jgi:hypothetical protein
VRKNKKLAADEIKKLTRGTILTDVSIMWLNSIYINLYQ